MTFNVTVNSEQKSESKMIAKKNCKPFVYLFQKWFCRVPNFVAHVMLGLYNGAFIDA
jgi:hypothetical protein